MKTVNRALQWFIIIFCTSLLLHSTTVSQEKQVKLLRQYIHRVWTNKDGLPHNSGRALVQTQDGYIWIGTQDGLVRFNGKDFLVFDKNNTPALKHNDIASLIETADSTLWIGTYNGLVSLKNGVFKNHPTNADREHEIIRALAADREGNLWVGTMNAGLQKYKDGQYQFFSVQQGLSNNVIQAIAENHQGDLLVGTEAGVNVYRHGKWSCYDKKDGLPHENIRSLYVASDSTVWIGTNGGLVRWRKGKFRTYTTVDGLSSNGIRAIYEDRLGVMWIGTGSGGICQFVNEVITPYRTSDGLSGEMVVSILEDREENLWVGTYSEGLNKFWKGKFYNYTSYDGLPPNASRITSLIQTRNNDIWIGTSGGGVMVFDGIKFTRPNISMNLINNSSIRSLFEDSHGNVWIGTQNELIQYRDGNSRVYTTKDGLKNTWIRAIGEDQEGHIWVGTLAGGIHRMENGRFVNYRDKGIPMSVIRSIFVDHSGATWIGSNEAVMCWRNDTAITYIQKDGLPSEPIYDIIEDSEHTVWMGSYGGGLTRLKGGAFTRFTRTQGLFDDVVYQILEDNRGNLWMSGLKGISCINKQMLNDFADGKIDSFQVTAYTTSDGMVSNNCTGNVQSAGCKTSDGRLWFPTDEGIVVLDPDNIRQNLIPPPVMIEQVVLNKLDCSPSEYIHIPVGAGQVEFYYSGLCYRVPEKVNFQSKLEGLENEWQSVGTRHEAFYTNLAPGKYVFRVKACNSDGIWNEKGASFAFELEPRFYQTYWFYVLVLITLSGTAFGTYRLRVRQLLKRKHELERYILERKKAEDALTEERGLLRTLIDNMPDRIYAKDLESRFIVCNKALAARMGMSNPDEIVGKSDFDLVPLELAERFRADELAIMQSGQSLINREEPMDSATGTTRWNLATKVPLRDSQGNIIGVVGMGREITERKQAEKALQESEKRFKEMFDDAPVGYHELDIEGCITRVNKTELEMLGYAMEEMVGQPGWKFVAESKMSRERIIAKLAGTLPPSKGAERSYLRKDGTELPVLTEDRLLRDAQGKIAGIRTIIQNLTERKQAEEAQKESEERYQRLVEFSPDAIGVYSNDKFVYVNPTAIKLLGGKGASDLIDRPFLDVVHPDCRETVHQKITAAVEEGKALLSMEEKFLRLDGGTIEVELTSLPIIVGGKPAIQIVAKDITEQKRLRQELLQSQKMQSIGTLAGGIAHDFNNILNIILGYTTLLHRHKSDDQKFSESTTALTQTVQRGAALVRQILTFARKTDVLIEPINLLSLIHELIGMLKQTFPKVITFREELQRDIPCINADYTQVHQAILNLCVNARDAMPNGGTITIKVEQQSKEQVMENIPAADQDSYICISVSDTGQGMDNATRLRIFDPFFTTKPLGKGTGMGLSVVYGAIQAHHGYIQVESEPGHGTTFRLFFPAQSISEQTEDSKESIEYLEVGGTETILIVEDEEFLLDLLQLMLESKGYKVYSARDGVEALEIFESHKQEIKLVFSDMGLPGLTGIDEFRKLKVLDPNVRIIFASGFFEADTKSELLKAGVKGFIQKPYMTDEILRIVRKVLDGKVA